MVRERDKPRASSERPAKVVVERLRYDLARLMVGVRPENLHQETDWGPPRGREIW